MSRRVALWVLALVCTSPLSSRAQEFRLFDRSVQVHGWISQGFAYSGHNNWLTMDTSSGSGAVTDMGLNMSTRLADRFRVGAQVYDRNFGQLGNFHPSLDWAFADYRFTSWLGVRVGKVKTPLGLYGDTQDEEFLHTWALLPQSNYPLDLRSASIAHEGGDIYGHVSFPKGGALDYTGYWGLRTFDPYGGIYIFSKDQGIPIDRDSGKAEGGDFRWTTPLKGLMLGVSGVNLTERRTGHWADCPLCPAPPPQGLPYTIRANPDYVLAGYGSYQHGRWHLAGEFRREYSPLDITSALFPGVATYDGQNTKACFLSVAYRISKRLEVGTYHARFLVDHPDFPSDPNSNHIYDQTVTVRFDFNRWWNAKIEGHFMDGYGDIYSAHGFYFRSNLNGLKPNTNVLVLRSGLNF